MFVLSLHQMTVHPVIKILNNIVHVFKKTFVFCVLNNYLGVTQCKGDGQFDTLSGGSY